MILQKVDVPIFPNRTQCEVEITKALREVTKRPGLRPTKLTPGELCAGGEPKKFCINFCFAYTLGLWTLKLNFSPLSKQSLLYCIYFMRKFCFRFEKCPKFCNDLKLTKRCKVQPKVQFDKIVLNFYDFFYGQLFLVTSYILMIENN